MCSRVGRRSRKYIRNSRNPLGVLGETLFQHVLLQLDAVSLGRCQAVSRGWQAAAKADFLWAKHCEELWEDKIHVHPKALDPITPRLKAYQISIQEGCRTQIAAEDLCSCNWNFRFKKGAGDWWLAYDPYWRGKPCMHRFFHKDGFISAEPDDDIWGSHECIWSLDAKSNSVQINNWPPLVVTRSSAWGWRMENCWAVYTSYNPCGVDNM